MTRAIYIRRADGDFDFVAAFNKKHLPNAPSDWPNEIAEWFMEQREEVLVIECGLSLLPERWDGTVKNLRTLK